MNSKIQGTLMFNVLFKRLVDQPRKAVAVLAIVVMPALPVMPAVAGEGHDHGDAPAAVAGPALPRFSAGTDLFEVVGIVDARHLRVYLDRADTNAPVKGATLDLEFGGAKVALKEVADGEFEGELAQPVAIGVTPVVATITAGADSDIVAADLDVHDDAHADEAHAHTSRWWIAAAAAVIAVIAAVMGARARANARRQSALAGGAL